MNRRILFSFLFSVLCSALWAQSATHPGQAWWGKWNSALPLQPVGLLSSGTNVCAMRLLADDASRLRGSRVCGLRFFIGDKSAVSHATAWLSSRLTGSPDIVEADIPLSELRDYTHDQQPTEVLFAEPLTILPAQNPYASVYAGFTLTLTNGTTCQLMAAGKTTPVIANSNFYNGTDLAKNYGPLAMQLLVEGGSLQAYELEPQPFGEHVAVAGQPSPTLDVTLVNWGTTPVSDVTLSLSEDGSVSTHHVSLPSVVSELGLPVSVQLPLPLPSDAREYACQLQVAEVNGVACDGGDSAADGTLIVLQQQATRRTVMEEFTGTWCPNCVRGITGITLLEEQFGDLFVPPAIHATDPMALPAYATSAIKRRAGNDIPACSIDRRYDCDPYLGDNIYQTHFLTDSIVAIALAQPTTADLSLTAHLTDDGKAQLDVATTFWYSSEQSPYRLILVLGADSLVGEGRDWQQVNGLYQKTGYDDDLAFFTGGPRYIDMAYDHVPIAVAGVDDGLPKSIQTPLVCGQAQHFTYLFSLSSCTMVQDDTRLFAVAMLLDTRTGIVANAAKCRVLPSEAEAISTVRQDARAEQSAVYTLQGRRVATPAQTSLSRGLYIRDGRKFIVH